MNYDFAHKKAAVLSYLQSYHDEWTTWKAKSE